MLTWIAIGVGGFFVLATAVAFGVASMLGVIARDVSVSLDWAEVPVSREAERQTKAGSKVVAA